MGRYLIRRILQFIPVFFGATLLIFVMVWAIPGDPIAALAGDRVLPDQVLQEIRDQYHLDDPLLVQYAKYMGDVFRGDFGEDFRKTSSNPECGAGPMEFSQYGPLQIGYLDGKFAGWFLREGEGVVTSDGIRPGATIDALKGERQVRELDTTLPGEFEYTAADYGTIRGFAESGKITALQAGVSCFFR